MSSLRRFLCTNPSFPTSTRCPCPFRVTFSPFASSWFVTVSACSGLHSPSSIPALQVRLATHTPLFIYLFDTKVRGAQWIWVQNVALRRWVVNVRGSKEDEINIPPLFYRSFSFLCSLAHSLPSPSASSSPTPREPQSPHTCFRFSFLDKRMESAWNKLRRESDERVGSWI